jgi:hypothetical protein
MAVARLPSPSEGPPPVAGNVCWWGFGAVPGHSWSRRRLAGGRSRSRLAIRLSCFRRSRSADLAVRLKCDVVAHPVAARAPGRRPHRDHQDVQAQDQDPEREGHLGQFGGRSSLASPAGSASRTSSATGPPSRNLQATPAATAGPDHSSPRSRCVVTVPRRSRCQAQPLTTARTAAPSTSGNAPLVTQRQPYVLVCPGPLT